MNTDQAVSPVTDDLGDDVLTPLQTNQEYAALCAVADAADEDHRAHCLLLSNTCPICKALAELDLVRQGQRCLQHN